MELPLAGATEGGIAAMGSVSVSELAGEECGLGSILEAVTIHHNQFYKKFKCQTSIVDLQETGVCVCCEFLLKKISVSG